jgi:hypothetical protein
VFAGTWLGHFPADLRRHVQIELRTIETDMAEIRGEVRQLCRKVGTLFVPSQKSEHSKGVSEIVKTWARSAPLMRNARDLQRATK